MTIERKWWKESVGYEIYIKSFFDSNNDGIGDIRGIIEKLDYLKELGVNLLWLCPFYKSPMDDNGYDVSDFYDIAKEYGTLDDVKELISKAHQKNIKIIADLVLNHTSDEHPWFIESRKSRNNPYRNYYIWRKPKYVFGKEVEPTNWASFFGGSCWQKDEQTGDYYMKIFSRKMPDLNWKNPDLRNDIYKMAKWWLDMGIDGFRVDAVAHLGRGSFADSKMESEDKYKPDWRKFSNLPVLHSYLKELNQNLSSNRDIMTVGEVGGGATIKEALRYSGENSNELNMVFNFDHNWCNNCWDASSFDEIKVDLMQLKDQFKKWQLGLYGKSWAPIYWLNHDHPRVMTTYGNYKKPNLSGKMLATSLYFMWGTPFIYNGEEIGMTNYPFSKLEEFHDVQVFTKYKIEVENGNMPKELYIAKNSITSRDNARTPMQWSNKEYGGFSQAKPWMNVNPNYVDVNVESQINDPNSLFSYYKKVIDIRLHSKYSDTLIYGKYNPVFESHERVYAYERSLSRSKLLVLCNFFDEENQIDLSDYQLKNTIISNYDDKIINDGIITLRPYEAVLFEVKKIAHDK